VNSSIKIDSTLKDMITHRPRVLIISDLFPTPPRPAQGIFIEHQTTHSLPFCAPTVVVPTRIFPHLHIWREWRNVQRLRTHWQAWRSTLAQTPFYDERYGYPVYYPRYSSSPRQFTYALWGWFAYPALFPLLRKLHRQHPFDLIHAHYGSPAGVIALLARRWMHVPVMVSVHGLDVTYTGLQNGAGRAITAWVFRQADLVTANSTWTAARIRAIAPPRRLEILHLGGNLPVVAPSAVPDRADFLTLLSVGYLEERKGHAYMLRALRQLLDEGYNVRYVIVGDGPCHSTLEGLTDDLALRNHVEFAGYKTHHEVEAYFAACDIFALPSWNEAFGIVYVEALSMGKPSLGCAGEGGPADLAALGDCIELVQPRDVASLVAGLRRLIVDPQRRQALATCGQAIVAQHFTWERNGQATGELYRQLLQAPHVEMPSL
jgi:teichuronic acid biosynthesis glycosyltransferase TuaC